MRWTLLLLLPLLVLAPRAEAQFTAWARTEAASDGRIFMIATTTDGATYGFQVAVDGSTYPEAWSDLEGATYIGDLPREVIALHRVGAASFGGEWPVNSSFFIAITKFGAVWRFRHGVTPGLPASDPPTWHPIENLQLMSAIGQGASDSPARPPNPQSQLRQSYPNPFNPRTTIEFELLQPSEVSILVYDEAGRMVATLQEGTLGSGGHRVQWDGRNDSGERVASGVYLYRLRTGDFVETKRMVLVK